MRKSNRFLAVTRTFGCVVLGAVATRAVVFYATPDPTHNTTEPTGTLSGSGWQYQGAWMGFSGTVIAPSYFITVKHVGGEPGTRFRFRDVDYVTTAFFDDPETDLRIWRVCGTFPAYAKLYENFNEPGRTLIVFGRGAQRGDPVTVNGQLKGWKWGAMDGAQRWGLNQVSSIANGGKLLKAGFDANGIAEEAHLSGGDSGGAVFIQDGAEWKLAGLNLSVDSPYNTTDSGPGFGASIFDEGGLYKGGEGKWSLIAEAPGDIPGAFYAIRISSRIDWIRSILAAGPEACSQVTNDFDADGWADLLFEDDQGFVGVWFMAGTSLKSGALLNPNNAGSPLWRISGAADFNGDGQSDLLFQHSDGTLGVWFMQGTKLSHAELLSPTGPSDSQWRAAGTGDFNRDGKPDIVFQHEDGTLAVWHMDVVRLTAGVFFNPRHPGDARWRIVGTADLNRDGQTDLVFQHTDGTVAAWYLNGLNFAQAALLNPARPADPNFRVRALGDYNRDGQVDLVFQNDMSGALAVWLMQGIDLNEGRNVNPSSPGGTWKVVGPR